MANTESTKTKNKTVKVMLQRDPNKTGSEADQEFFSVNGKNYLIKTDEMVDVPEEVAYLIENINKQRTAARKFANKMAFKDSKPAV